MINFIFRNKKSLTWNTHLNETIFVWIDRDGSTVTTAAASDGSKYVSASMGSYGEYPLVLFNNLKKHLMNWEMLLIPAIFAETYWTPNGMVAK